MNPHNQSSHLNSNTDALIKSVSNRQFVKFPLGSKPSIRKGNSIQQCNHCDDKSQMHSAYEPLRIANNNSQKSLSSAKTPRRVPYTPRKQRSSHSKKLKTPSRSNLHDLLLRIKILLKDLEKFLENLKNKLSHTIQDVIKDIEKSIKTYFLESTTENKQLSKKIMEKLQTGMVNEEMVKQDVGHVRIIRKLSADEEKSISNGNLKQRNGLIAEAKHQNDSQIRGNIFSNTIHIRDKLRKDATSSVLIRQEKGNREGTLAWGLVASERKEQGGPEGKQMARSIEKLQRQLKSLKNILNE